MVAPLVSVFLPAFNRGDVIGASIQSILNQTFQDFEILVCGDGCTDNTGDVVCGFNDPRIRWFDLPKGPGRGYQNRNYVLLSAQGQYIAWAQHDDLMMPDHLERMVGALRRPECYWVYSTPLWVGDDGLCIPFLNDLRRTTDFRKRPTLLL